MAVAVIGLIFNSNKQRKPRPAVLPANQQAVPWPLPQETNPIPLATNPLPPPPPPTASSSNSLPVTPPATPHWAVTILAGQAGSPGSLDGAAAAARFQAPGGVAVDSAGNVYVADTGNNAIRKISPYGAVTTLAGLAGSHGSIDSLGGAARFWAPFGIAVDKSANLYVAEMANGAIRKISSSGNVSTLAGLAGNPGTNDGVGDNAQFRNPWGVAVDRNGTVYVADTSSSTIRKITPAGAVSTLAGLPGNSGFSDGIGAQARFWNPHGVAVDAAGNLYVADTGNNIIRKITSAGAVSTLAGRAGSPGLADGAPGASQLRHPQGLALDGAGRVYVADTDNGAIRELTPTGTMTTLVITGDLGHPDAIAVDAVGNLYVADTINNVIRKVAPADTGGAR
jgi:sugar lactone lactonase YvrE